MCEGRLRSSLSAFASDVGIVCFDGPGILGICWDDVSIASLSSGVSNWCIGADGNSFINYYRFWVDGDDNLEWRSHTVSSRSGSRSDRVGNGLSGIGSVG